MLRCETTDFDAGTDGGADVTLPSDGGMNDGIQMDANDPCPKTSRTGSSCAPGTCYCGFQPPTCYPEPNAMIRSSATDRYLTLRVPFIVVAWTLQKYGNVPEIVKRTGAKGPP